MKFEQLKAGAVFKVVEVDPDGSGMDYSGHFGATITRAQRCCGNCIVVFGRMEGASDLVGFLPHELELMPC